MVGRRSSVSACKDRVGILLIHGTVATCQLCYRGSPTSCDSAEGRSNEATTLTTIILRKDRFLGKVYHPASKPWMPSYDVEAAI